MPTTECLPHLGFNFHPEREVRVGFDAPELSSDGGLLLLRAVDDQCATSARVAALFAEKKGPNTRHSTLEIVRQRVYQIACGYEDVNDATRLRHDPLLRVVVGRALDGQPLASQPTLSRFENAATLRDVARMQRDHERRWCASIRSDLEVLVLDIDGTDDPTHGQQELTFFNGHYDTTMYAPLLVFDQDGQLASARLRPGNKFGAQCAAPMLERLVRLVRTRFPALPILVRADAAFATPAVINRLDRLNEEVGRIDYLIALKSNSGLRSWSAPIRELAAEVAQQTRRSAVFYDRVIYKSERWGKPHFVIVKASHDGRVADVRYLISTVDALSTSRTYAWLYTGRGDSENRIKDFKNCLDADRLSCHRFAANACRLQLHAAAYELMHALRAHVMSSFEQGEAGDVQEQPQPSSTELATDVTPRLARWQFNTMRERLLKVAAQVRQTVRRVWIQLPKAFPFAQLFCSTALRIRGVGVT